MFKNKFLLKSNLIPITLIGGIFCSSTFCKSKDFSLRAGLDFATSKLSRNNFSIALCAEYKCYRIIEESDNSLSLDASVSLDYIRRNSIKYNKQKSFFPAMINLTLKKDGFYG